MKKLFLFAAVVALTMGFGCALSNYALITDNDQGGTVNTNGKAYIKPSSQIAFIYPDGTDNETWWVNQATNGDRVLDTINFHRALTESPFKDDLYCSPDWTGCSVVTCQDPETNDTNIFDYKFNTQCSGARSLVYLFSTSRYYGECGRTKADRMTTMLNLMNQMTPVTINGNTWLHGVVNSTNFTTILDNNNGATAAFSPAGDINVYVNARHQAKVDLTNPVLRQSFQQVRSWVNGHPSAGLTTTRVFNGISVTGHGQILTDNLGRWIEEHY